MTRSLAQAALLLIRLELQGIEIRRFEGDLYTFPSGAVGALKGPVRKLKPEILTLLAERDRLLASPPPPPRAPAARVEVPPPTEPHGCLYGRHFVRAPEEPSWRCEWCHPVLDGREDHVRHTIPKQHASAPPATPPPEAASRTDPPPPTTPCRMCGSHTFHHRPGAARWTCQSCHPRMSESEQVLYELPQPAQEVADG